MSLTVYSKQSVLFSLRNEVGNITGMEFEGFKRSMAFFQAEQLEPSTFISDGHTSVIKQMSLLTSHINTYLRKMGCQCISPSPPQVDLTAEESALGPFA